MERKREREKERVGEGVKERELDSLVWNCNDKMDNQLR